VLPRAQGSHAAPDAVGAPDHPAHHQGRLPQSVLDGCGGGGKARVAADMWRSDPTPSAAHIVVDNDGTVACLCDLATTEAYHATVSNPWSIGIEMYQESGSGVHAAVYDATVQLVPALCRIFGIQFQIPRLAYKNRPLRRMVDGGKQCVGVFRSPRQHRAPRPRRPGGRDLRPARRRWRRGLRSRRGRGPRGLEEPARPSSTSVAPR